MTEAQGTSQWTRIKGRIFAWHLDNPLARLPETLLLGDCRSAIQEEWSRLIRGDEAVLDIGAGTGRFSLAIAKRLTTGRVICLDLSEEMLQHLRQKAEKEGLHDRIQILRGEAAASRLESESVDFVMSNSVFHELSSPGSVLKEMLRVLKPGGWVLVTDFRDTTVSRLICRCHHEGSHGPLSVGQLETLLGGAGLKNVRVGAVRHWVLGVAQK